MTFESELQAAVWQKRLPSLILAAFAYIAATLCIQGLSDTPPWLDGAPVEVSTDVLASIGLLYAALRSLQVWSHRSVRRSWLFGCAGMFAIWCVESTIDRFHDLDYRIAMAGWLMAAALLFRCMQSYGTRPAIFAIMWFGFTAQLLGHLFELLPSGVFSATYSEMALLEMACDGGELVALASYMLAFVMARYSGLDERVVERSVRLKNWTSPTDAGTTAPARPRICFSFIAQMHQAFHSLPIAVALARRHPDIDVHVAGIDSKLTTLRGLVDRNAGASPLRFDRLYLAWPWRLLERFGIGFAKILTLRSNRHFLAGFDAVVVPERTSTYLRRIAPEIRLIGTEHGAGDREVSFSPQIARYDFVLLPGQKQARRLLELGYVRPGKYHSGVYAKLDWALTGKEHGRRLFDNNRLTVVYNPHFDGSLSSWPLIGRSVLDFFAESTAYNLIFAPHIRMFDPARPAKYEAFRDYQALPHMLIDLGSERCVDMTYTIAADVYLGDVSSQVVEFITRPRPCIFLNPRKVEWQQDLHYRFWHIGTVVEDIVHLRVALAAAKQLPEETQRRQQEYLRDSMGIEAPGEASPRGADAIVRFLKEQA